ncbi:GntR family transcriptional regulator [Undibacterium arcticum]|uniref:GntR family transcriptional regulator n=1 Tax=Undibacterium arcticum TaxID=1762892 RepID=UPI00360B0CDF
MATPSSRNTEPLSTAAAPHDDDLDEVRTALDHGIEERVYIAISSALLGGKLRPNMQLRERNLAEVFGCSRGVIRKVLARLGVEGKLVLKHNRGAFVPCPSAEDMRQVYYARRVVETGIVTMLCGQLSPKQIKQLQQHVQAEELAFKQLRRDASIHLAGEFHVLLAQMVDSEELLAFIKRLVAKTELYKALYDPAEFVSCAPKNISRLSKH